MNRLLVVGYKYASYLPELQNLQDQTIPLLSSFRLVFILDLETCNSYYSPCTLPRQPKMPSTTYSEFNVDTEALEVAKAFADGLRGKTALVTGVNRTGIGFSAAEAIVSL